MERYGRGPIALPRNLFKSMVTMTGSANLVEPVADLRDGFEIMRLPDRPCPLHRPDSRRRDSNQVRIAFDVAHAMTITVIKREKKEILVISANLHD